MSHARTWNYGFLAAAIVAAAASSAHAALDFTVLQWDNDPDQRDPLAVRHVVGSASIEADNGERQILLNGKYVMMEMENMYAYGGKLPVIKTNNQIIINPSSGPNGVETYSLSNELVFNFNACLSPSFTAQANGSSITWQETDGHLVLNLHFEEAINIMVTINEGGIFATKGEGEVGATVGQVTVAASGTIKEISKGDTIVAEFDAAYGCWSAAASTAFFTDEEIAAAGGVVGQGFTDYQIIVDNSLWALAEAKGDYAFIAKKFFNITVVPPPETRVPEPASLGILGLGMAGLMLRRRK